MYLLYLDEFGHPGRWDPTDPRFLHHPLFGLCGPCVRSDRWHELDRGFLRLKRRFYSSEIAREFRTKGLRPERFEPKRLNSRRDFRFAGAVLRLLRDLDCHLFAHGQRKRVAPAMHDTTALYNATMQGMIKRYERFLRSRGRVRGTGVMVLDEREAKQDSGLLASAQSFLFGASDVPSPFRRVIEIPLLVPSAWYHGVQAADVLSRVVGGVYRWRTGAEGAYRQFETAFGGLLDSLTWRTGTFRSIHVSSQ